MSRYQLFYVKIAGQIPRQKMPKKPSKCIRLQNSTIKRGEKYLLFFASFVKFKAEKMNESRSFFLTYIRFVYVCLQPFLFFKNGYFPKST